jgi:hypothetical protein
MEIAASKRQRYSRSGVLQPDVPDGRSRPARRLRRLADEFASEVGTPLSPIDRVLVGQAAALALRSEQLQTAIVSGQSADTDEAVRLASESRRILVALKGKAGQRAETQSELDRYLAKHYGAPEDSEAAEA